VERSGEKWREENFDATVIVNKEFTTIIIYPIFIITQLMIDFLTYHPRPVLINPLYPP
jgi:hypothetical protein